jgi:molybdopterin/thiamine biosynthesis adenylyltransferase
MSYFDYRKAFSRNIGWVTEEEQTLLSTKKIAIAGLGGVGGTHLLTLSRLGCTHFHIADFDEFEIHNFNRQSGAFCSTIGRKKLDVMEEIAQDINPNSAITTFPQGISEDNLDEFLDGVDLYVDSLDFFCLPIRRRVFKACHEKGIPAVTAAPLGMGTAFLYFKPGKMSFEQYFNFQGTLDGPMLEDDLIRFLIGLSPSLLQMGYLVDESRVDFKKGIGPSTVMSCDMCAGVVGVNALKILLGRGDVLAAPKGLHFDAYKNKLKKTHRLGGNKHPIQKILFKIVKKVVSEKS